MPPGQQPRSSQLALSQPRRERRAGEPPREEVRLEAGATAAFFLFFLLKKVWEARETQNSLTLRGSVGARLLSCVQPPPRVEVGRMLHRTSASPGAARPRGAKKWSPKVVAPQGGGGTCVTRRRKSHFVFSPWINPTHSLGQVGKTKNPQRRNGDSNLVILFVHNT